MSDRICTILITGAGSGVGRGLCLDLCRKGHHILATDQNGPSADETLAMMGADRDAGSAYQLDVTSADDLARFTEAIGDDRIDVLINNAGLQHVAPLEEFPQQKWDHLIDVMLSGACRMTRAVLPGMRAAGFGRIINIGSVHSLVASPFKSAYVAAKHGLHGFAKVVALETADVDVTINTICPAYVRTPLVDAQIKDQARTRQISEDEVIDQVMLKPMPKRQFISVEEIAATVEFLISNSARNITGQTIVIDGGWTIQ
ncbi:MAG: 3-hydroxybutyrate dehydrogenase [Phycisphaeraceae bacterium]|nr:3-hydroxybutyrate dehydrogenase [Phycisphaeraceae bacterium]